MNHARALSFTRTHEQDHRLGELEDVENGLEHPADHRVDVFELPYRARDVVKDAEPPGGLAPRPRAAGRRSSCP